MEENYDYYLSKMSNTLINLDKASVIDGKRDWEDSWVSAKLKATYFIKMLEVYDFKFSDFLIINLYSDILFNRVGKKDVKPTIATLRRFITITKKEEEDLIRNGFKRNKNNKKIYKRIIKSYKNTVKEKTDFIGSRKIAKIEVKDYLMGYLDEIFKSNTTDDSVTDELGTAVEEKLPHLFIFNYLVSIYMSYEKASKAIYLYGEVLEGELKDAIQEKLVEQLGQFISSATNNANLEKISNDFGLGLAVSLVDNESIQMQNDKAFYSKMYLEEVNKSSSLEKRVAELEEELEFFRSLYKNKLKNKKVILIGDKKKEVEYKEVIASFGGEMFMTDSFDDFSKINNSVLDGFDYIVLFTYYTSHSVSNKLGKYSDKTIFVNSSSKIELEKALALI